MCSQCVYVWLIWYLELELLVQTSFKPVFICLLIPWIGASQWYECHLINMFLLWSMTAFSYICVRVASRWVYSSLDCIWDLLTLHCRQQEREENNDECLRDNREEEEDGGEDTERRKNVAERPLLVSLLLFTTIAHTCGSDCDMDMNYISNRVESFSKMIKLVKMGKNPIDWHWKRCSVKIISQYITTSL